MDLTEDTKRYIDSLSYIQLLRKWRFSPSGDKWFQGATGEYWGRRMLELKAKGVDHVKASKQVDRERRK